MVQGDVSSPENILGAMEGSLPYRTVDDGTQPLRGPQGQRAGQGRIALCFSFYGSGTGGFLSMS